QGITHRDLKPSNVMVVSRAGRLLPKLIDFGIATMISDSPRRDAGGHEHGPQRGALSDDIAVKSSDGAGGATVATRPGAPLGLVTGSPHYMAPEQWERPAEVDRRADLYALAVLSYQSITGRVPCDGASLEEVALAHRRRPLAPLGAGLPAALDEVLHKALAV